MTARTSIEDFAVANPLYTGASVTCYTVSGGVKTATKATLYEAPTGSNTLPNPQLLDSDGKFGAPVYIEVDVIAEVSGTHIQSHDTGVIQALAQVQESAVTQANQAAGASMSFYASARRMVMNAIAEVQALISYVSAAAAEAMRAANKARAAYIDFTNRYQGSSASNPTTRPDGSALQTGDLYYNSVAMELRIYDGSAWVAAGGVDVVMDTYTGDGVTTTFGPLSATPGSENSTWVFTGAGYAAKNTYDFSGGNIVFSSAPPAGRIEVMQIATATVNVPADGSVSTAKLAAGVVNGATTVTAATNDHVLIADASDSGNFKKALVSDLGPTQASTAEIAAESAVTKYISPDRAKYGPGFAKAWLNLNGQGTIAARDSYGLSSVSDDGAGEYGGNLSTPFANTGYAGNVTGEATNISTSTLGVHAAEEITNTTTIQRTASVFPFVTKDTAMADYDALTVNVVMHGDI